MFDARSETTFDLQLDAKAAKQEVTARVVELEGETGEFLELDLRGVSAPPDAKFWVIVVGDRPQILSANGERGVYGVRLSRADSVEGFDVSIGVSKSDRPDKPEFSVSFRMEPKS